MPCWWWAIIHYRDDSDAELAAKKTLQINAALKMTIRQKIRKKEKNPEKTKDKNTIIGILKKVKKTIQRQPEKKKKMTG